MQVGKRTGEFVGAGSLPLTFPALPTMTVIVNNKSVTALIDSGCSKTVVLKGLIKGNLLQSNEQRIVLANGDDIWG